MALWNLACLRLLLGEYAAAWPGYEQRWTQPGSGQSSFQLPQWKDNVVLVTSDQALGDTIQFARYLPLIQKRGGNVVFGCQPALAGLMAGLVGADKVIAQPGPLPACDMHMQLLSLPGIFGTTLATIPKDIPYLHAKRELVERWRGEIRRGENRFQVGIVWQGSMTIKGDRRSCHLSQFAPLAEIPNVSLVSLQVGAATAEIAGAAFPIVDLGSRFDKNSLDDLAAVIANLDLVVTVDTAAAHLAGALGVSVWTLLQFVPDWRWLLDRDDSPWYPTMRLFRQKRWGDWEEVFERVATELERGEAVAAGFSLAAVGEMIFAVIAQARIKGRRLKPAATLLQVGTRTARDRLRHVAEPLLEVEVSMRVGVLMLDHDVVESEQQPLGREEIHDDAMRQFHRFGRRGADLRIEAEIEHQFFRRDVHAAEIRVDRRESGIVRRDLVHLFLAGARNRRRRKFPLHVVGHRYNLLRCKTCFFALACAMKLSWK